MEDERPTVEGADNNPPYWRGRCDVHTMVDGAEPMTDKEMPADTQVQILSTVIRLATVVIVVRLMVWLMNR